MKEVINLRVFKIPAVYEPKKLLVDAQKRYHIGTRCNLLGFHLIQLLNAVRKMLPTLPPGFYTSCELGGAYWATLCRGLRNASGIALKFLVAQGYLPELQLVGKKSRCLKYWRCPEEAPKPLVHSTFRPLRIATF